MRIVIKLLSFTLVFAALSGCGATRGDRTVSGAAIGAGVGALVHPHLAVMPEQALLSAV